MKTATAKRSTKKKPVAKAAAKPVRKVERGARKVHIEREAMPNECFWVNNGPILKNRVELREALKEMSDEQFHHHVSEMHNDFARWLELALAHPGCAKKLRNSKSRAGAVRALGTCSC
jgi:hypothetical protein